MNDTCVHLADRFVAGVGVTRCGEYAKLNLTAYPAEVTCESCIQAMRSSETRRRGIAAALGLNDPELDD